MTLEAARLLAGLLVAHFLADFTPLATSSMHEAKARGGPPGPILRHALVHGVLAALALAALAGTSWSVLLAAAGAVLLTHFVLDFVRARLSRRFRALGDPADQAFWVALGADQLAHALVLVGVVAWVA